MRRLQQFFTWLKAPGWQGWGTILTGTTLVATIFVAGILVRFSQQEEKARQEATKANFLATVILSRRPIVTTDETPHWLMTIELVNQGPVAATPLRIDMETGGHDVEPMSEPTTSHGEVDRGFFGVGPDREGGICYDVPFIIRVSELLLRGDKIVVSQPFRVSVDRDLELNADMDRELHIKYDPELLSLSPGYLWMSGDSDNTVLGAFLQSLSIRGSNVDFSQSWRYDDGGCQWTTSSQTPTS